ncbi:hypothetical protein QJU93_07225 [Pasteurella skyensis]|uniref:Uncharacterized protein n=1 Tax=Phocoenobacter skyensis TaxID=97481 RepID=A0AAJ6P0X7_9PAST|nr:hypothetical protein [Pasteurella skyensis]MDP8173147.1 hypothetical protein [Pasteurella skyensis]MDP8178920.1 hypothetical protein [Pasteurella skyensis]
MTFLTKKATLSEIRAYAKKLGMTFKAQNATINNQQAYMLINRTTKQVIATNFTLHTAYENMRNGYFYQLAEENNVKKIK